MTHIGVRAVAIAVASVALLAGCGAPMGLGRKVYLVKPGTDNPVHVVRCEDRPRGGGQWAVTFLVPFGGLIGPAAGYEECIKERTEQGYVEAQEPECAYWRDDAKPGDEIKIRDRCKDNAPEWTSRGVEAGKSWPHVAVAPTTPPRSSYTMLVGTWSGTVYGQQGSYPLTITFKDDGTYDAASATLKPGTFEGTWQLSGGTVVWKSITTGRTGTATVQEANGKRTLRLIPDDGTSTVELTPTTEVAAAPADFRTWLRGNWAGIGGGYDLTISSDLNWEYTSTVRGRWYASGTARIEGPATIVLEGWFKGIGRAQFERLTMVLHRRGESLAGEFRLSQTWVVTFSRSSRPATK